MNPFIKTKNENMIISIKMRLNDKFSIQWNDSTN